MRLRDKLAKVTSRTESGLWSTNRVMVYIAAAALFAMMMITIADIIGRYVFNNPIKGTWELVGFLLVGASALALGYCQIRKGHIRVDFLLKRFPEKMQAVLTILAHFLGLVAFSALCWQVILYMQYYLSVKTGNATDTLHIPFYPFVLVLAIGAGMLALVLLFDLVHSIIEVKHK
jgi:TRAP-type C4-dicarboxylate transport system permease small subunit